MSGDVWASVLGQFPPQPPDGVGRGSVAFPDTHNLVLLRKVSDRHKLRDAIFVCRNRPACFPDVEIRKSW